MKEDKALKVCQNSKQRGGVARLLSTDIGRHIAEQSQNTNGGSLALNVGGGGKDFDRMQPEFGLMVISTREVIFLKENPGKWRDLTHENLKRELEKMQQSSYQMQQEN